MKEEQNQQHGTRPEEDPPASIVSLTLEDGADEDVQPPKEDPPALIVSLSLEEGTDEDEQPPRMQPPPPQSPPPAPVEDFGETLQKKAGEEMERLKNLIFGIKEELVETEADTEEAKDTAAALKKEIEDSMQEREAMVKRIESEFA